MLGRLSSLTSSQPVRPTSRSAKTTWRWVLSTLAWQRHSSGRSSFPLTRPVVSRAQILKLLSEEVFDFSRDEMTSAKAKKLKESFNNDFSLIFQLCEFIMSNSTKSTLLVCTFQVPSPPSLLSPPSRRFPSPNSCLRPLATNARPPCPDATQVSQLDPAGLHFRDHARANACVHFLAAAGFPE